MRCLYCYNPEIVLGKGSVAFSDAISFLKSRQGLLDAVVFSGGECLMHKKFKEQIREVKQLGFLTKIDTNGSKPGVLQELISENLVDYVALDFKATPAEFTTLTQTDLYDEWEKSFRILLNAAVAFEIRTTVHSELTSPNELNQMMAYLDSNKYSGNYCIQPFRNNVDTLSPLRPSSRMRGSDLNSPSRFTLVLRD